MRISEKRVNHTLLGPLERPALLWLAARLPGWVRPDLLTLLGFLASLLILASYYLTNFDPRFLWLASFGFLLNWFGDSLDGTLARFRQIERPKYGFFVDHTVDTLVEVCIFLGMGLSPYVDFRLASLALIGYLMLSILVFIKTYVDGEFRISWARLGPTEMRVIAVLANTIVFFTGNPAFDLPFGRVSLYNAVVGAVILLLFTGYLVILLQQAGRLAKLDQPAAGCTSHPKGRKNKAKVPLYSIQAGSISPRGRSSNK